MTTARASNAAFIVLLAFAFFSNVISAFSCISGVNPKFQYLTRRPSIAAPCSNGRRNHYPSHWTMIDVVRLNAEQNPDTKENTPALSSSPLEDLTRNSKVTSPPSDLLPTFTASADDATNNNEEQKKAKTNTVNERLLAEIQQQHQSSSKKRLSNFSFSYGSPKTDQQKLEDIQAARDLNGINPFTTLLGSAFALICAYALWNLTLYLTYFFTTHPVTTDVYTLARIMAIVRNVVIGIFSLAAFFFGVTGLGIGLLGVRVGFGVASGELDPTPIIEKTKVTEEGDVDFGSAWDLMLGKKRKRSRDGNGR